nr:putative late blight resistance protein homolog R1B-23 [Ipomoea batatas]
MHLFGYYWRPILIPNNNCIVSCKNLMKLHFCSVSFEGKTINTFSKLPKLEVLLLMDCKWIGGEWELLEKEDFDHLIYLKISKSNIERWEASACHFRNLERLVLEWCQELEKIPAEFAEIPSLKSIKLYGCLHSAVDSAKEIQREQHEQGNDNMVVIEKDTIEVHLSPLPFCYCLFYFTLIIEFHHILIYNLFSMTHDSLTTTLMMKLSHS